MEVNKLIEWMIKTREKELEANQHRLLHDTRILTCSKCRKIREEIKELEEFAQ